MAYDACEGEGFNTVMALNYCSFALSKIVHSRDRVLLDNEYATLINFLNLEHIRDRQVIEIIKRMMDTLTKFKLETEERSRVVEAFRKKSQKELLSIISNQSSAAALDFSWLKKKPMLAGITGVACMVPGLNVPVLAGASTIMLGSIMLRLMANSASAYADYQRNAEHYQEQIENLTWKLEKEALKEINELNKVFLETYWEVITTHEVPDRWRVTLNQISLLLEAAEQGQPDARYRTLLRLEAECGFILGYWHHRALAAHESMLLVPEDQQGALREDIRHCTRQYEKLNGIFRRDSQYASLLMLEVSSGNCTAEEIAAKVQRIIEHDARDTTKRLFVAVTLMQQQRYGEAIEHLQANIDAGLCRAVSRSLLSDAYAAQKNDAQLMALIERTLRDDSASHQEILSHLGKVSSKTQAEDILQKIQGLHIQPEKSLYGRDHLMIDLSSRWFIDHNEILLSAIKTEQDVYPVSKVKSPKGGMQVQLVFENVMDLDDILKLGQPFPLEIYLHMENFPVFIRGALCVQREEGTGNLFRRSLSGALGSMPFPAPQKPSLMGKALKNISDKVSHTVRKLESDVHFSVESITVCPLRAELER